MNRANRHNVFVSYHHTNPDQDYRDQFEKIFENQHDIFISNSVQFGDIDPSLSSDRVRQIIRDKYLCDSTVTIVLIGASTWSRKHVDWEIGSSIRDTKNNPRSGLLGIFLPSYPLLLTNKYNPHTIPPRLHDNINCSFATIHNWSTNPIEVQKWIHAAFKRRNKIQPDNGYPNFINNKSGGEWS